MKILFGMLDGLGCFNILLESNLGVSVDIVVCGF